MHARRNRGPFAQVPHDGEFVYPFVGQAAIEVVSKGKSPSAYGVDVSHWSSESTSCWSEPVSCLRLGWCLAGPSRCLARLTAVRPRFWSSMAPSGPVPQALTITMSTPPRRPPASHADRVPHRTTLSRVMTTHFVTTSRSQSSAARCGLVDHQVGPRTFANDGVETWIGKEIMDPILLCAAALVCSDQECSRDIAPQWLRTGCSTRDD